MPVPRVCVLGDQKAGTGVGREAHKGRDICIIMADSRRMAETNRTL